MLAVAVFVAPYVAVLDAFVASFACIFRRHPALFVVAAVVLELVPVAQPGLAGAAAFPVVVSASVFVYTFRHHPGLFVLVIAVVVLVVVLDAQLGLAAAAVAVVFVAVVFVA